MPLILTDSNLFRELRLPAAEGDRKVQSVEMRVVFHTVRSSSATGHRRGFLEKSCTHTRHQFWRNQRRGGGDRGQLKIKIPLCSERAIYSTHLFSLFTSSPFEEED